MKKALTYVEVDIDYCALTYGVAPCMATLEGETPTGTIKCFNTLKTCQDRENFSNAPVTLRFAQPADYLPRDIDAIPVIESVSFTPAIISLGENLGQRASLTVTLRDHLHSDTGPGFDKYHAERPYNPYRQGTFWGKFRARQPFLRGRAIRLIRGELGQALADMETRHFIIESFDGPTPDGSYSFIAKDALKMVDGDRAQAPKLSNGFLVGEVLADATTATLSPSGVGSTEYPLSGYVAIGGKEICEFTRSGDVLTLMRAQFNTEAVDHDAQDRVQLCLQYFAEDPADIISDLFQSYAGVPSEYIPLDAWKTETSTFNRSLYTALIAEPTGVDKLISEIIQQGALAVWWDDIGRVIRLQVLRQISTDAAVFDQTNTLDGTLGLREQPEKRISQVWTYFAQNNPLKKVDDEDNYRSSAVRAALQAEADYGTPAIKKIFARWIPEFGRQAAIRVNDIQIGRFRDGARRFNLSVFRQEDGIVPELGRGYRIEAQVLQTATGEPDNVPVQITRLKPSASGFELELEEASFISFDDEESGRAVIIDFNTNNVNFRDRWDALYPEPVEGDVVRCIVEAGITVGSNSTSLPAFDVGEWPEDVVPTLIVRGRIQGAGGVGGLGRNSLTVSPANNGLPGGPALYTRVPIDLEIPDGEIFGGGGGGGSGGSTIGRRGGGGGGGSGTVPGTGTGTGAQLGATGTRDSGGAGGRPSAVGPAWAGGRGGNPGQAGQQGGSTSTLPASPPNFGAPGGAAGSAIDGESFVTITEGPGDIRGPQIN